MGLPTEILRFFRATTAEQKNNVIVPFSVGEFISKIGGGRITEVRLICQKFVNEGFLIHSGIKNNSPLAGDCYYNYSFSDVLAQYGTYDFVALGFFSVRNHFTDSVKPVIVKTKADIDDIGTCFYIGNNFVITARHCIENMKSVKIPSTTSGYLKALKIFVPKDERIDIALIQVEDGSFEGIPGFLIEDANILDEVLTMGYPPISGFDAIQFAEIATINAHLKSSLGDIIGADKSYLDAQEYLLINARVKGGNSGGPIINKRGAVVGMLVNIPTDPEDSKKLDALGYGVAIPAKSMSSFFQDINDNNQNKIVSLAFENLEIGFKTLL